MNNNKYKIYLWGSNIKKIIKKKSSLLSKKKSLFSRNPRAPCHDSPDIDVSHWKEEVTQCRVNGLDIVLGSSRKISPCTSCTCTKEGVRKHSLMTSWEGCHFFIPTSCICPDERVSLYNFKIVALHCITVKTFEC